ncbi:MULTISPECIES: hypothetical protein [unclassified Lysobacter]
MKAKMKTAMVMMVVAGALVAGSVQALSFSNPASGCRVHAHCRFGALPSGACCYEP